MPRGDSVSTISRLLSSRLDSIAGKATPLGLSTYSSIVYLVAAPGPAAPYLEPLTLLYSWY